MTSFFKKWNETLMRALFVLFCGAMGWLSLALSSCAISGPYPATPLSVTFILAVVLSFATMGLAMSLLLSFASTQRAKGLWISAPLHFLVAVIGVALTMFLVGITFGYREWLSAAWIRADARSAVVGTFQEPAWSLKYGPGSIKFWVGAFWGLFLGLVIDAVALFSWAYLRGRAREDNSIMGRQYLK